MSKFKQGDKVKIIKYGHLRWYSDMGALRLERGLNKQMMDILIWGTEPPVEALKVDEKEDLSSFVYSKDGDNSFYRDVNPEIVGKIGTVEGSYKDLYGGEESRNDIIYSIKDIPTKTAWYDEEQLELYDK